MSLLRFYQRNLIKFLPFILIVFFSVFSIIVSSALLSSSSDTIRFYENIRRTIALVYFPANAPEPTDLLKNCPFISGVYKITPLRSEELKKTLSSLRQRFFVIGTRERDLEELMKYFEVRLKKGRLPQQGKKEIILVEQVVKNRGKVLGEEICIPKVSTRDRYRIVGTLKGKSAVGFYPCENFIFGKKGKEFKCRLITFSEPMKYQYNKRTEILESIHNEYMEKYKNFFKYSTEWTEQKEMERKHLEKGIKFISNIILIISTITFSLISVFLTLVYFEERLPEYGLFLALGLNKFQIMKRALYENFGFIFISWLLGLISAGVFLAGVGMKIFIPQGWFLHMFPVDALPNTMLIPLGMLLCIIVVVAYKLNKIDSMEIIERKW